MKPKYDAAGGLTQESKLNVVGCNKPQPRFDDDSVFYTYSKGPNVSELTLSWPYRGRGKGPSA